MSPWRRPRPARTGAPRTPEPFLRSYSVCRDRGRESNARAQNQPEGLRWRRAIAATSRRMRARRGTAAGRSGGRWVDATASASRGGSRSDFRFDSLVFEFATEHFEAAPEAHLDRRLGRPDHTSHLLERAAFDEPGAD